MKKAALVFLMGIVMAAGVHLYLKREQRRIAEHFTMTTALAAKKYIGNGKPVETEMVEEVQVPLSYLPPGALQKKSELLDAKGRPRYKAGIGLLKTDVLTKSKLLENSSLVGLAWILQPGETAMSVKLSAQAAVAGLLQPGDWVSVLWLREGKPRQLLPRVRVGAVNDQIWDPAKTMTPNEISKNVAGDGFLVTLILTPVEAMAAALAAEQGNIVLTLLSPLETELVRGGK